MNKQLTTQRNQNSILVQGQKLTTKASETTGSFPLAEFENQIVSVRELQRSQLPLKEVPYLAVGGGMGSFVWVDHLRIYGVQKESIAVISTEKQPHSRYKNLCENSQIPAHERLRSDSQSCPDNIWGYPGYAMREMYRNLRHGQFRQLFEILWKISSEPTLADTYTPRSGNVFAAVEREAERIGWDDMLIRGRVRAIRKTDDGRYAVVYSKSNAGGHAIMLANYIHLAVGYPAIRLLDDLYTYRDTYDETKLVVNAYEEHEHVYKHLEVNGGTVLVRGRGIVASRIIQRIYEAKQINNSVTILHLMRTPVHTGNKYLRAGREVYEHWEYQPFNWPRDCWTGRGRKRLEKASAEERAELLNAWGGTTTADRSDWRQIIREGLNQGWYDRQFGTVVSVEPDPNSQKVITCIHDTGAVQGQIRLGADFIVDATGLISNVDGNPLLKDLLHHYQLKRNTQNRIAVTNDFEIEGMRNANGRMYASGIITLGGPHAAVDSFLGLQYAALRSVDSLVANNAPELRYLDGLRSLSQWIRWAKGAKP